jgi:hypothetical protein
MAKPFKKPRSIINAFARAARRIILGAAIGIGTLLPSTNAFSQQRESSLPLMRHNIELVNGIPTRDMMVSKTETDTTYNQTVNDFLLESARQEYAELCKDLPPYSRALEELQTKLNAKLEAQNGKVSHVIVLDPYKFDVAFALGFKPPDAVMLQLKGHEDEYSARQVYMAAHAMLAYYTTPYMNTTYTSNPMTISAPFNEAASPALLIPMSEYAPLAMLDGLSKEQSVLVVNTHESWHVLDNRYDYGQINFSKIMEEDLSDFNRMVNNPEALKFYSLKSQKETFADVASLGELIRTQDFGTDLIDKVLAFRTDHPDIPHMSALALDALKTKIERKGLEDFRKMSSAEAEGLYYKLTDKYGMSPESLRAGIIYEGSSDKGKHHMHIKAIFNREVKKALKFKEFFVKDEVFHLKQKEGPSFSLNIFNELQAWNPLQELQDRAFAAEGKITPSSLSKTYLQMQIEFSAKMKEDPKNDIYPEKMAMLKVAFVNSVEKLDYVQINLDRGVTLTPPLRPVSPFSPFLRM